MLLSHAIQILAAWRRYNATVSQLSTLSDRDLADLGLTRSQIRSVAYRCAFEQTVASGREPRIADR